MNSLMATTFKKAGMFYRQPLFSFARKARQVKAGIPGLPQRLMPGMMPGGFPPGFDPNDPDMQEMMKSFS
jgi:hypothetical protein